MDNADGLTFALGNTTTTTPDPHHHPNTPQGRQLAAEPVSYTPSSAWA